MFLSYLYHRGVGSTYDLQAKCEPFKHARKAYTVIHLSLHLTRVIAPLTLTVVTACNNRGHNSPMPL